LTGNSKVCPCSRCPFKKERKGGGSEFFAGCMERDQRRGGKPQAKKRRLKRKRHLSYFRNFVAVGK